MIFSKLREIAIVVLFSLPGAFVLGYLSFYAQNSNASDFAKLVITVLTLGFALALTVMSQLALRKLRGLVSQPTCPRLFHRLVGEDDATFRFRWPESHRQPLDEAVARILASSHGKLETHQQFDELVTNQALIAYYLESKSKHKPLSVAAEAEVYALVIRQLRTAELRPLSQRFTNKTEAKKNAQAARRLFETEFASSPLHEVCLNG